MQSTFSAKENSPICFDPSRMTAKKKNVELLITFVAEYHDDNWVFQQDNAPIHVARYFTGRH